MVGRLGKRQAARELGDAALPRGDKPSEGVEQVGIEVPPCRRVS